MPKNLIKSRLKSSKQKLEIKPELNNIIKSNLPPYLQSFNQKLLS